MTGTNHRYQHVILISLDTLRSDCITAISSDFPNRFFGRSKLKTVMLDYLVTNGIYLSNCISAAPYTSASHAAYFTGCWPRRNGVYEFFNRQIGCPTIFELARKANIHTIFQTDFPVILGDSLGFKRGVNRYFIESEWSAFKELLKNRDRYTVSFFHFGGIHYPYGFHKLKFAKFDFPHKVRELERKFNIDRTDDHPDILDESYRDNRDKNFLLRYKTIVDTLWIRGEYSELNRLYVEGIDYFLKKRFNRFIKDVINFVDNTDSLLILFSDHGENWASDSRGHSNTINDTVLRVPVVLYGKGVAKSTIVSKLTRTIDILPTICQYSKIIPTEFDGMSINLTDPANFTDSREAFAQVWRVGDRLKVYQHQQRMLSGKKIAKPLVTKLEKEAVYYGGFALNREYSADSKLINEILFKNTGRRLVLTKDDRNVIARLRRRLRRYNHIKRHRASRISEIDKSIINDLNTLGYHV